MNWFCQEFFQALVDEIATPGLVALSLGQCLCRAIRLVLHCQHRCLRILDHLASKTFRALDSQSTILKRTLKECEGLIDAPHLESCDAGPHQWILVHQELLQMPFLLVPELQDRNGQLLHMIGHHPDLLEQATISDALGQSSQLVEGDEELLQIPQPQLWQEIQLVLRHVQHTQIFALTDALRKSRDPIVAQINKSNIVVRACSREIMWQQGNLIVRQSEHLKVGERVGSKHSLWNHGDEVVVKDDLLNLGTFRDVPWECGEMIVLQRNHVQHFQVVERWWQIRQSTPRQFDGVHVSELTDGVEHGWRQMHVGSGDPLERLRHSFCSLTTPDWNKDCRGGCSPSVGCGITRLFIL
mmetsp:Transcript_14581/g.40081  ORF Transcript_14581/g.40081 Transcript_14581/m.40081 type:complete len:355 (-) Transcript_14581:214-1278(-)